MLAEAHLEELQHAFLADCILYSKCWALWSFDFLEITPDGLQAASIHELYLIRLSPIIGFYYEGLFAFSLQRLFFTYEDLSSLATFKVPLSNINI